jgi:hypothetical protein
LPNQEFEKFCQILFNNFVIFFIKKAKSENPTAQELEVIRKFLADNGINAEPKSGELLEGLETLPFEAEQLILQESN